MLMAESVRATAPLSVLDASPLAVAAPAEKVVESVAVAQNVERIVMARLPPAFDRRVAHVRGTICRWLHPTPGRKYS